MTHNYKGTEYQVFTGSKGGQYILVNDKKIYIKKKITKVPEKKLVKPEPKKSSHYICYYEERIDGELVDDFKEWCEADSLYDARRYFENEYRHNPNVSIAYIVEE